jgi:hypothetical protein
VCALSDVNLHDFSLLPFGYVLGVVLFKLLCGSDAHPFISDAGLHQMYGLHNNNNYGFMDMCLQAASHVLEAPCVLWPVDIKPLMRPEMMVLIDQLLLGWKYPSVQGLNMVNMMGKKDPGSCHFKTTMHSLSEHYNLASIQCTMFNVFHRIVAVMILPKYPTCRFLQVHSLLRRCCAPLSARSIMETI